MHLKAIKLRGFKSFPDAVEVRLEPGVAVVVGPNGSGKSNVADAIVGAFEGRIQHALTNQVDHKTELQETLARIGRSVGYVLLEAEGPPHERTFTAAAVIDGEQVGVGRGRSKKDAEQLAAREALARLEANGAAAG